METPVLKNSRDLWNLVCDACAKSCPIAAYFRVWIEMDFILDDIWIVTSRSRWVPTWRTSWFRMVVRLADENYPSWGINYDEPSMTTPSSHVEVANSPWPARSNVPSWVTRIISARFCWVVWHRSELSFFEKKKFWLNSTEQSVGALQGNNTQIPRFQSIPLGSKSFRPVLYHHGELRPHFNLILTTDLRTEDRALQTVDLIPRKLSGKHTVDWKNMKKYCVSYFFHVGFQHRIISWFSFCFWLVFEVNSTASRRGGLGLSAFVQPVPFATEATSSFGVDEAGWMHMDALNVAFCMDFVLMVLWSIFNCLSGIICFAYDCGMDAINNNRNKA